MTTATATHICGSEAEYYGAINERPPDRLYWCRDCDIKFWFSETS